MRPVDVKPKRWFLARWWAVIWSWLVEPDPMLATPRPLREQDRPPLVVISASLEWNVRQNALAEAMGVAKAVLGASDPGLVESSWVISPVITGIRALMTEGPVLASNPFDDRVPNLYELATMYRDVWAELDAEQKRSAAAKEERDAARAELAKAKGEPMCLTADGIHTECQRAVKLDADLLKANAALQSVRSDFVDRAVVVLNEALKASPVAITDLVEHRVRCHPDLAKHPTVQVREESPTGWSVGLLGMLNGILGLSADGFGPVTAVVDTESRLVTRFERSVPANRDALGVEADPIRDLAARLDVAEQEVAALKMRALQAEEACRLAEELREQEMEVARQALVRAETAEAALARSGDHSEMYREAWAALGAPDCGLLKWRSVLDEIEAMREERDQFRKMRAGVAQALNEVLTLPPTALPALSLDPPREARIRVLRAINAALGIERSTDGPPVDVLVDLETERIIHFEFRPDVDEAEARVQAEVLVGQAPVVATLFPRAKAVLAAALNWFDARELEVEDEARSAAQRMLYDAVEEWIRRGPDPKKAITAARHGPQGSEVDEAEARARRELVESANLPAIICDPRVFRGKPSLCGARIAVEHILGMMAAGDSVDDLLRAYPKLERTDILACLRVGRLAVERLTQGTHDERARCARIARTALLGEMKATLQGMRDAIAQVIEAGGAA